MCYPGYVVEIHDESLEFYKDLLPGIDEDEYDAKFADWFITIKQVSAGFMSHMTGTTGEVLTEMRMPLYYAEQLIKILQNVISERKVKYKTIISTLNKEKEREMWIDIMDKLKDKETKL